MLQTDAKVGDKLPCDIARLPMSEALGHLRSLRAKGVDCPAEPGTLYRDEIKVLSNVFQLRSGPLNADHVKTLAAVIADRGNLDAVTVWRCGAEAILIDGHHRLEAYAKAERKSGFPVAIPVVWFDGTAEEAVATAGVQNSRAKLPMSREERSNSAWKLVKCGGFTKAMIAGAASVSDRTVGYMRKALKELGEEAGDHETWWSACAAWQGRTSAWDGVSGDEGMTQELVEQQAQAWADAWAKATSTKPAHNPTIAARALELFFGRKLVEVVRELGGEIDWTGEEDQDLAEAPF
jgi:hypothetical protein